MATAPPPEILGLLADPLRWRLVAELGRSDRRVGELVQLVDKPQNVVSYHLAELRKRGIVGSRRSSADRRDVYYRVDLWRCRDLLGQAGRSLHPAVAAVRPLDGAAQPFPVRPRVLFLCTGNSARSQMAEALVGQRSAGAIEACSAGSHPKALHPNAVRVMGERGIDLADRQAKPLTRFVGSRFDRVVTLCDKVREVCPEFPGSPLMAHWSIADPAAAGAGDEATYPAFRQVADEIDGRVAVLLAEMTHPDPGEDPPWLLPRS